MTTTFRIAAVQACPVYLDRSATIDKACRLIAEAGAAGAQLVVFPEAFIPAYPLWVWYVPSGHTHPLRELYAELVANSVSVPSADTDRLCQAAKAAGVVVAMGINELNSEGSSTSIYNSLLYIGADGSILGKHRKVVPTGGERLVWTGGDGSDLEVYNAPFGRLGGLLCWENYMPLPRYALAAWGVQIYVAPTWDCGEPWLSTMRKSDVPDRLAFKEKYLASAGEWLNPGDSVIVDPDGKLIAGPASQEEKILYAEADLSKITGSRWQLDVAGHYARPDIFELIVHRAPKPFLTVSQSRSENKHEEAAGGE